MEGDGLIIPANVNCYSPVIDGDGNTVDLEYRGICFPSGKIVSHARTPVYSDVGEYLYDRVEILVRAEK